MFRLTLQAASVIAALWVILVISGFAVRVGQEMVPATDETFGTENGMVAWSPARDSRLLCRYFTGRAVVEVAYPLAAAASADDSGCPWTWRPGDL